MSMLGIQWYDWLFIFLIVACCLFVGARIASEGWHSGKAKHFNKIWNKVTPTKEDDDG